MEISKELKDFLNDSPILDLIANEDWKKLFSKAEVNLANDISTLHKILVNSNLTSTDQILQSLSYVPAFFFKGFDDLRNITLPNGVTSIGENAFYDCSNLINLTLSNNITSIGYSAFAWCTNLTNIILPDSLTSISDSAFYNCKRLKSIVIPDGVTSIDDWTFEGCSSLTNITIPDSVTSIGYHAFQNCKDLKTIYFNGTKDQWNWLAIAQNWGIDTTQTKIIFKG